MKRYRIFYICVFTCFLFVSYAESKKSNSGDDECIKCHSDITPGLVKEWQKSEHGRKNVKCINCHKAEQTDPDAFLHNGYLISTIVSPKDCAKCHIKEEKEFADSHHSKAAQFIGSLDNILGEVVEGGPAASNGCKQCHGSTVKVLADGGFDSSTWPNSGIGRINPDGSKGSCTACHSRHSFSKAIARQPENCGKCHMGPDHPQIEIYKESKHGIIFEARKSDMNLNSKSWKVGKDYTAAPTCATCHISATPNQSATHDVGARITWTLRPPISSKFANWEKKRDAMMDVCVQCHSQGFTDNFYKQYESSIELYNEKFAKVAKSIMDKLYENGSLTKTPFDEKLEWIYYELWHHQGRRARHGTAMMGPDYTQWHGFYEVAKSFYNEFLPEVEHLNPLLLKDVFSKDYHKWKNGLTPEQIKETLDFYQKRYNQ